MQGKTVGWGGGAGLQLSAVGPTGTLNLNATQTWTQERGEERGFKSEPVAMAFQTDEGKLAWTWTVKRMADTSLFAKRGVKDKSLIGLSTFARTSSVLEVQGTWSFPKDAERPVTLQAYVGQTLRYDAALQQSWLKGGGFQLKTCVNSPDKSRAESIQIPLKLPGSNSMLTTKARGA